MAELKPKRKGNYHHNGNTKHGIGEQKMANEKRLIDANAFRNLLQQVVYDVFTVHEHNGELTGTASVGYYTETIEEVLKQTPAVDAVEVVHGRWLYDSGSGKYFCSACNENALSFKKDTLYGGDLYEVCLTDYCPNCGAKMDGDGNG